MTGLEFTFNIIALIVGAFVVLCIAVAIWNVTKLEEENKKLREDLKKARARKVKSEYKKVKDVKKEEEK